MSNVRHRTITYRGGTLEEVLPRIRSELGSDAVIVRQREGVIGGVGGFFGKKCVEIEARAAAVRQAAPARTVIDAYDTGEPRPEPQSALLQTLVDQSSPFATELTDALSRARETALASPGDTPARAVPSEAQADMPTETLPAVPAQPYAEAPAQPRASAPVVLQASVLAEAPVNVIAAAQQQALSANAAEAARAGLLARGFGAEIADEIVADAALALLPFAPGVPFEVLAHRALSRRIRVSAGSEKERRIIALIGTAGSGRTLTTAKLCHTYAATGRKVTAVSAEHARRAFELAGLTDRAGIDFEIASRPEAISRAHLRKSDVVVVDTPSVDARDPGSLKRSARLLEKLGADETHVVMRSDISFESGQALLDRLSGSLAPSQILVTGADIAAETCMPVVLSLAYGLPISFVTDSPLARSGLHLAEPDELVRMALA